MNESELKSIKEQVLADIRNHLTTLRKEWDKIDHRIGDYVEDAAREDMDTANVYELAGIRKVMRLCFSYVCNGDRVRKYLLAIEGKYVGNKWESGGLSFDTPRGAQHVRLMPYQVWCLFGIYCFDTDVCMDRTANSDLELLPSEYVNDGIVWDRRRLCTEAHIFQTRKSGKTEFGAALDFVEAFVMGPSNSQVLVCANSREQSKIAYNALKKFAYQLDPASISKAGGKYLRVTADEMNFKPGMKRTASIKVMSAGGKKKDGLYASMVHADEHGSAGYVKDHSDMQDLVEVCTGSMGPRRERLLLHTTTAGLTNEGPYQVQLRGVEQSLINETKIPINSGIKTDDDCWFAFLLRLDPWDYANDNIEDLCKENLFRKVNRSIGTTVQPTWYRERLHDAMTKGPDTRKEVLTKDFNIWQSDRAKVWMTDRDIRKRQIDCSIDELSSEDGWLLFVGYDFSQGNDLHAASYLAYNSESGEFFADMDAWISERSLTESPLKSLYQSWVKGGWLKVVPGSVINEDTMTNRMAELCEHLTVLQVGYDSYKAKMNINNLRSWIYANGADPDKVIRPVSQGFATYTGPVMEMEHMIHSDPALISFSSNPMWPWEFGNCLMVESNDGMGNLKPLKSGANNKVDNVQALLTALYLFDQMSGQVNKGG